MSDFHERFEIEIGIEEARKKFINRVCNNIFDDVTNSGLLGKYILNILNNQRKIRNILSKLGKRYEPTEEESKQPQLSRHINTNDFKEVLQTIEIIYAIGYVNAGREDNSQDIISRRVDNILAQSELDLGIRWENGKFIRTGAKLLDDKLVNDPLKWLRKNGHSTVFEPFDKALEDFLKIELGNESLSDVIKDAYEALEALAKIILDNDQDLSKNREKFVSEIKGKEFHKEILRQYVKYGCKYRHAADPESPRPQPTIAEAEFFLYFTGTVLRLAMENWEGS